MCSAERRSRRARPRRPVGTAHRPRPCCPGAGCRWLVAETDAEGSGDHNTSLHNMLRTGFEPLYERVTWLWRG